MVRVFLIRHGETDWNKSRRIQGGSSDTSLNGTGLAQAEAIATRLKTENLGGVYSSPLRRAIATARAIAGQHRLEVQIELSLRELNVGKLEGVEISLMGKYLDELLSSGEENKVANGNRQNIWDRLQQAGGESLEELQNRAWSTLQRLVDQSTGQNIAIVSHHFVLLTIICRVLNLPLTQLSRLRLDTGSLSAITFDERATRLTLFNDTCHISEEH